MCDLQFFTNKTNYPTAKAVFRVLKANISELAVLSVVCTNWSLCAHAFWPSLSLNNPFQCYPVEPLFCTVHGTQLLCCCQGTWWDEIWGVPHSGALPTQFKPKWPSAITSWTSRSAVNHFLKEKVPDRTVSLGTTLIAFLAVLLLIFFNTGGKLPKTPKKCFSVWFCVFFFWCHLLEHFSYILIFASGLFICPMDLREITDILPPLPWPCSLEGWISHFNWYLTLLCPVISSKTWWRCPRIAPT